MRITKKIYLPIAGLALICGVFSVKTALATEKPIECTTICGPNPDYDCQINYSDGSSVYCTYSHSRPPAPEAL